MNDRPTCRTVATRLETLRQVVRHEPCWTCECLQGYLAQLAMDADDDHEAAVLIAPLRAPRNQMHPCLGCQPCPPGDLFVAYLQGENSGCGPGRGCGGGGPKAG